MSIMRRTPRLFLAVWTMWMLGGCGGGNNNPDGSTDAPTGDAPVPVDGAVDGASDAPVDAPTDGTPTDGMVYMDARPDAPIPSCTISAPLVPTPVAVAAATFQMGCNATAESIECNLPVGGLEVIDPAGNYRRNTDNEKPSHSVSLSAYWIYQTEVTQAQYLECVKAGECEQPYCWQGSQDWDPCNRPNHPVVCVNQPEAQKFCNWREGGNGRLPTEAEWELAARGTDGNVYPWGDASPSCTLVNFRGCNNGELVPVGSHPMGRSPYGLDDMAGNVVEWIGDWYAPAYYASSPNTNPTGPTTMPQSGERVGRGGGVGSPPHFLRTSDRDSYPTFRSGVRIGFRCVRTVAP